MLMVCALFVFSASRDQTAGPILTSYTLKRVFLQQLQSLGGRTTTSQFHGVNIPKNLKIGPNTHFPAKTAKSYNGHIC